MATEIDHEGQRYILKSDVEGIIRERVGKVAEQANSWEAKAKEAQTSLDDALRRATTADTLAQQVQALTAERDAEKGARERFSSAVKAGIQDSESIEFLELAHSRAMRDLPKKDQASFPEWIASCKSDPNLAPSPLRHLFAAQEAPPAAAPQQAGTAPPAAGQAPQPPAAPQAPAAPAPAWASAARGSVAPPAAPSGLDAQTIATAPILGDEGKAATADMLSQWRAQYGGGRR